MNSIISAFGMLLFGTLISLTSKILYMLTSTGLDGRVHKFEKPWFQTTQMFFAEMLCGPLYLYVRHLERKERLREAQERTPLLSQPPLEVKENFSKKTFFIACIPAIADLSATASMMTGLLYVTVSVNQLLRGSEMIFAAILSVLCLHRKIDRQKWLGISCCFFGLLLVGLANLGAEGLDPDQKRSIAIGFCLIVLAQIFQASQVVIEEFCLHDLEVQPMVLLSYEGILGSAFCWIVVIPALQWIPGGDVGGSWENTLDTFVMLKNSWALLSVEILDAAGTLLYNFFGLCVVRNLSAVHRVVFEALRTLLVWLFDLALFYVFSGGRLGEPWTSSSWLQALGFVSIVTGTYLYNRDDFGASSEVDK